MIDIMSTHPAKVDSSNLQDLMSVVIPDVRSSTQNLLKAIEKLAALPNPLDALLLDTHLAGLAAFPRT